MSYQPWNQPGPSGPQLPMMRASHADRERTVDVLKAGFAEGRLDRGEYEQRLARADHARTCGELQALIGDLPQGPMAMPAAAPQPYAQSVPRTFLPLPPRNNGTATAAMICGVLTPITYGITAIPAVILGHKARAEIRRTGEGGDGMALAGVVIGWLAIGVGMLIMVSLIAFGLGT